MRVTSPPTALPIAVAILPLLVAALVPLAVPTPALAERWLRPVPGEVARFFSYAAADPFAAGAHRGVDLRARPGAVVRAACAGTVSHAGSVAGRGVVSVRCGARRVSYLPVAGFAVRAGARVRIGERLGTVGAGHGGLHFGVRRAGDPFGYLDPLPLLAPRRPALPVVPARRARPRRVPALPRSTPPATPAPRARPARPLPALPAPPAPRVRIAADRRPVAPWPVWAGLTLLLAGAAGSGTLAVRRRRRSHATSATAPAR